MMKSISLKALANKLANIGSELWPNSGKNLNSADIGELCIALLQLKGEASSVAISEEIISCYQSSDVEEKLNFFLFLFDKFSADSIRVDEAIEKYQHTKSQQQLFELSRASESPRQDLFRALNMAKDGIQALILLREDLSQFLADNPKLKAIDYDLLHLFKSWFNRGFLELKRIDWQTPAEILETLIKYESVHEIKGWDDLRRRLESDRRCFGFFHPALPHVPLIFVEVALTNELHSNIADIINEQKPPENEIISVNTAVFYSINNCFEGLKGVSFGNFLIKQVVEDLAREMPEIETYCTLSPVPGFLKWLKKNISTLEFLGTDEIEMLNLFLQSNDPDEKLSDTLLKLCAHYFLNVKMGTKPLDPVARFHLGNGACLERLNPQADLSANGLKQSAGIMVNYLYDRKTLTRNHEAYEQNHEVVCSNQVKKRLP